ncbi:MAG TPA: hypothetical protein VH206_12500 [Xanthobacteraceae bacterium]|jgi:hypothetical protein|nr:hypothetical protein [Xanthobacteraceae bacterium]
MKSPSIAAFDARLDAWVERHWPALSVAGYALGFASLFGGVALHAYQSHFAHAVQTRCGATCLAIPGFDYVAAALCGAAAILLVWLIARTALTLQSRLVDSVTQLRPGNPSTSLPPLWTAVLHCLIGCIVFFVILALATPHSAGRVHLSLHGRGALELFLGWWIGGLVVLKFFWRQYRLN